MYNKSKVHGYYDHKYSSRLQMYLQSGFEFALQLRTIRDSVYLYIFFLSKFAATRLKDTVSSLSQYASLEIVWLWCS